MKKILLSCLLCLLPLSASQAEIKGFFGAGVGLMTWEEGDSDFSTSPNNVYFRGGVALNRFIDLGVEWSTTLIDDKKDNVEFEIDSTFIFAKANLPISDIVQLYAIAGASSVDLVVSRRGGGSRVGSFDDNGTGLGAGIQIGDSDGGKFVIEYLRYYQDDEEFDDLAGDITVESVNIGYMAYF